MNKLIIPVVLSILILSCRSNSERTAQNNVKEQESSEWVTLFDGSSFDAWKGYLSESVYPEWTIEDGVMVFTPGKEGGKNIVTRNNYTNFILSLEWKISEGGNSGIFWGVHEDPEFKEAYQTGPEIQVLDNERHPDAKAGTTHQAGALYDMIAPSANVVHPAGEWNSCMIMVDHNANKGTVTLNGTEIVSFPVHGEAWDKMVENSKFKGWEGFGKYTTGKIGLQDHGDKVWYRNIKIKELK